MKKFISLLVTVCMVITLTPTFAFAAPAADAQDQAPPEVVLDEGQAAGEGIVIEDEAGDVVTVDEAEAVPSQEKGAAEGYSQEDYVDPAEGEEGWIKDPSGHWLYYNAGAPVKGKQIIGYYTYYFDDNGYMQTGWQTIGGYKYYFVTTKGTPGASTYGTMVTGWMTLKGYKYYFDDTGIMATKWLELNGNKYYFNTKGQMQTGLKTISNAKYFFDDSGKMHQGWKTIKGARYYFNQVSGKMHHGWLTLDDARYYFNTNGKMHKGWKTISNKRYFFDSNGKMHKGWKKVNGYKYYLNPSNGVMKKGMLTLNGDRYFLNQKNGRMVTGWVTYKSNRYYFDTKTGKAKKGLCTINGLKYYFSTSGVMKTGIIKIGGNLYYFQVSGSKKGSAWNKGWFTADLDGKQRYGYSSGKLAVGTVKISGMWYQFSTRNGALQKKLGDDIDQRMQKKSSSTGYLLYVSKSKHQVRVYKGSKGNWSRAYTFTCSVGKSSTPTKSGTFYIGKRGLTHSYKDDYGNKVKYLYWVHYSDGSGRGFNSILYWDDGVHSGVYDGNLGQNNTGGSIRLSLNNAKYIYNYVPDGTTTIVE